MSPKRKMIILDESDNDDSFKHRRSSLRVNLSYSTNLSDSGNGSLGRTPMENCERSANKVRTDRALSKNREGAHEKTNPRLSSRDEALRSMNDTSKCAINDDGKISIRTKERIQLKRLTINLADISAKEQTLAANCKRLKDAILNKTEEIFDKRDELSIRTAMVLTNEKSHSANDIHNLDVENESVCVLDTKTNQHFGEKRSVRCNQHTDAANNRQKKEQHSIIIDTPLNGGEKRKSDEKKVVDRSKLTPKRLFAENDKQGCKIIEDIILSKNVPILSLRQTDQKGSPILSGSYRRLQLLKNRTKLLSQNRSENHNSMHLSMYSDRSVNIGPPIVCSTFIEDRVIGEKGNKSPCDEAPNNVNTSQATTNKIISMEMTEIHGGIRLSENHMSPHNRNPDMYNDIGNKNEKSKAARTNLQKSGNVDNRLNKLTLRDNNAHSDVPSVSKVTNNQGVTDVYRDAIVLMGAASIEEIKRIPEIYDVPGQAQESNCHINKQSEKQCTLILSDSSNSSIRSSLNVNTSLDAVAEIGETKRVQKSSDYKIAVASRGFGATTAANNNEESTALDDQSANTIRTSLQMNTSIDTMCKTQRRESIRLSKEFSMEDRDNEDLTVDRSSTRNRYSSATNDKEACDIDILENISLIERLRNISTRDRIPCENKQEVRENGERTEDSNRISAKYRNMERACNNSGNGSSCVEATPYPVSRSILLRSQLRRRMQCMDNNAASCSDSADSTSEEDNSRAKANDSHPTMVSNKMYILTGTTKTTDDTIILGSNNSSLSREKLTDMKDKSETEVKMNERNTVASQDADCIPAGKSRRRLLPLNENSQLCSLVPFEECSGTSEKSLSIKKGRKKLKNRRPKKKSTSLKRNTKSGIKHNIASERTHSDTSDCDVIDKKKRKEKREEEKKTRKPRKIVSKKIVIKKFVNENVLNILKENRRDKRDQSTEDRDSLGDFMAHRMILTQWNNKYRSQKIVIVTTGLSKGDKGLVKSIVKSLGMAETELNVSRRTTHVVSTGVRTVNLLRGIIRGCWLITLEWVLKSLENNAWLNPEEFEMKHFSKAVLESRKDRQLFGPSYIPELFAACGFIYIEHKTTLPCDTLKELIKTAGGHITENPKFAKIIIGANGLKETWVIDSITTGELQLTKLYQRE